MNWKSLVASANWLMRSWSTKDARNLETIGEVVVEGLKEWERDYDTE